MDGDAVAMDRLADAHDPIESETTEQYEAAGAPPMRIVPADDGGAEAAAAGEALTADAALPPAPECRHERRTLVEALLFAADAPVSAGRIAEIIGISDTEARLEIAALNDDYVASGRAFRVRQIARGFQLMTEPQFSPWVQKLNRQAGQTRLSETLMETLAIVAYRQPIIRADIESIRGVACGDGLNRLRELGLVKIIGRAEIVGRPILYGTTRKFLDVFGLADISDLPPLEVFSLKARAVAAAS